MSAEFFFIALTDVACKGSVLETVVFSPSLMHGNKKSYTFLTEKLIKLAHARYWFPSVVQLGLTGRVSV